MGGFYLRLRALSYGKFLPGLKKIGAATREFQPGAKLIFFYFISPRGENIFAKICAIFYKAFLRKKSVSYAVRGYLKTMMLDYINAREVRYLILKRLK